MSLIRTSFLNGVASIVRVAVAMGLNKVIAVYVGPSGYALIGQLSNMLNIAITLGGGAISTGVTKFTAQYFDNQFDQREIWRTAFKFIFVSSIFTARLLCLYSRFLSETLMGDLGYRYVFYLLAIGLPLTAFNSLVLSILNGKKEANLYVLQNILSLLIGALVSAVLAINFGLFGALVALILNQSLILFVTLWVCRKCSWMKLESFFGKVSSNFTGPIAQFALMSLIGALVAPLSQMMVREHIVQSFGGIAAGEWQGVFKISEIYLMLFTSTLGIYYLPRIAEIRSIADLRIEILKVYKFLLPASIVSASIIYFLRSYIVSILFSKEFIGMTDLFTWQLIGDVIKIGSWVLGFIMIGRGMTGWFIFTELLFSSSWVLISIFLSRIFGLQGIFIGFAINYSLYWIFMAWLMKYKLVETV